ncbi:MAG: trigger factor [Chloroflexota bacterium]
MLNLIEEKIGPCLVALQVEVEPTRTENAMQAAARRIAQSVRIPGFRQGRAPYHVVVRAYGKETVLKEAVETLGNEILKEAIEQQTLKPYENPTLEVVQNEPLTLKFTVPTAPVVDLGNYRALRVAVNPPEPINDAEVDAALEKIRRTNATFAPVERPAQLGDLARLDFTIRAGERTVIERKDIDRELQAGEDDVAPGFSPALVGMAMGETREFDLQMAADYAVADLAGQTLRVNATVHDIKEMQLPALDDELAKTDGRFETLAELRADVRKNLEENAARTERERYEADVLQTALANAQIEFPDAMVEDELNHSLNDVMRDVAQQGFTFENWLRMNEMSVSQLRASLRPSVEARLRNSLFLYNLAEREGIKIEAPDIEAAIDAEAAQYPDDMQETVRQAYTSENARVSIGLRVLQQRAMKKLISIAQGEGVLLPGDVDMASRPSEVLVAH